MKLSVFSLQFSILMGAWFIGCNQPPAVNPWRDDSIPRETWTTPSQDGILAGNHKPAARQRNVPSSEGPYVCEQVPHYPLWWEDLFEDHGDENDTFAWTWQDYFAFAYSPARYLLNTGAIPASALVTLPATPMVSDGKVVPKRISPHDAEVGTSPDPTATSGDFKHPESDSATPP